MRSRLFIVFVILLCVACERAHLYYATSDEVVVRLNIDWSVSRFTPNGVTVYIFDSNGDRYGSSILSSDIDVVTFKLPTDTYTIVVHNDSRSEFSNVEFIGTDKLSTFLVRSLEWDHPYYEPDTDEFVACEPEDIVSATVRNIVARSDVARYHYDKPDLSEYTSSEVIEVDITPAYIVHLAEVQAHIENAHSAVDVPIALVHGMSRGYYFDMECTLEDRVLEEFYIDVGTVTASSTTDDATTVMAVTRSDDDDYVYEDDRVNADNFGTWDATYTGTWKDDDKDGYADVDGGGFSAMSNYAAAMVSLDDKSPASEDSIKINADTDNSENSVTQLTSTSDVLMLIPQKLTAWVPTSSTVLNYIGSYATGGSYEDPDDETSTYYSYADGGLSDGEYANPSINSANRTLSYLAIDCEIYHNDSEVAIHDGYIFVPFETSNIKYASASVDAPDDYTYTTDEWLAGYKITYCLNFGGGYVVEEGDHDTIPEPGCIPDTETYTLRTITYTTTCDAWVDVSGGSMDLGEFDTSVTTSTSGSDNGESGNEGDGTSTDPE